MSWPRHNMVPMVPDSFRFTQPFLPDPIMLAQMQSLHIGNPIPFGGLSTSGYPDPQGMIQMRPPNLSPFISSIPGPITVQSNIGSESPYQNQPQNLFVTSNIASHHEKSIQDSSFPESNDYNQAIESRNLSEQQAKANANLELANRLNMNNNNIHQINNTQTTGIANDPDSFSEESGFWAKEDDFPPLK